MGLRMEDKSEQIEFIRQKCIEANPSIKDLVFGCEIKFPGDNSRLYVQRDVGDGYFNVYDVTDNNTWIVMPGENYKIIGRRIRLADVVYTHQIASGWGIRDS